MDASPNTINWIDGTHRSSLFKLFFLFSSSRSVAILHICTPTHPLLSLAFIYPMFSFLTSLWCTNSKEFIFDSPLAKSKRPFPFPSCFSYRNNTLPEMSENQNPITQSPSATRPPPICCCHLKWIKLQIFLGCVFSFPPK